MQWRADDIFFAGKLRQPALTVRVLPSQRPRYNLASSRLAAVVRMPIVGKMHHIPGRSTRLPVAADYRRVRMTLAAADRCFLKQCGEHGQQHDANNVWIRQRGKNHAARAQR